MKLFLRGPLAAPRILVNPLCSYELGRFRVHMAFDMLVEGVMGPSPAALSRERRGQGLADLAAAPS